MKTVSTVATVKILRSDENDCICCEGNHVFSQSLSFDELLPRGERSMNKPGFYDFYSRNFDLKRLDGRKIRVTLELLDE